jgi:Protein of unknown function (DUF2806)
VADVVVRSAADLALGHLASDSFSDPLEARQKSIEEVAVRAIGILSEEDVPPGAAAPAEDFMRMFEDMAERATTESVADLLARVLAGEIRKPFSVSRRTILAQRFHESADFAPGQRREVFDLLRLRPLRQQLIQMAAPTRRVLAGTPALRLGEVQHRLDTPAQARRRLGLLAP